MKNLALREIFGEELAIIAKKNKKIIAISPDLKQATKLDVFFKIFPKRSIEVGIAEANAIGIATGLSITGFKPVVASFASFLTGKNIEIRTSLAFNNVPAVLVGTHGGLIGPDGPTQAGLSDISIMRSIPNFKVIQPSTAIETKSILRHYLTNNNKDLVYLRISRQPTKEFYKKNHIFHEGDIQIISKSSKQDILIISSGAVLERCVEAKNILSNKKISVANLSSIKPINIQKMKKLAKNYKTIFTVEDHSVIGGLGSAINDVLFKINYKGRVFNHGLNDVFTQSGNVEDLYKFYKLDAKGISNMILKNLKVF